MECASERATILIVDDERGPRESLRILLKPLHQMLTASSGGEALQILRSTPVDLVTIDLNMPGMKGAELMRTVRLEFPDVEIIVITGHGTVASVTEGLRFGISDYVLKPFDVVKVSAGITRALSRQQGRRRVVAFLDALGNLVGQDSQVRDLVSSLDTGSRLHGPLESGPGGRRAPDAGADPLRTVELLELLAETIEAKDEFLRGHARRTACTAGLLADRLQLSPRDQHHVRIAAFFHDVGKVGVPSDLLARPRVLDPSERKVLQEHSELGARLVEPLGFAREVTAAIRHHHEWWDGSGYPDGLCGQDIPLIARIVCVADAFDAMTSHRPQRPVLPRPRVLRELRDGAGRQFDPDLVKEFLLLHESRAGDLDSGLLAESTRAPAGVESSRPSMHQEGDRR